MFVPNASPVFVTTAYTSAPDFALSMGSANVPASIPLTGTATLNVVGMNGWTGTAQLACSSGLPAGYTCSFSPASVTGLGQTVLTLSPTVKTTAEGAGWLGVILSIPVFRKRKRVHAGLLGLLALTIFAGCGTVHNLPDSPIRTLTVQASANAIVHSIQIEVQ